MKIKEDKTPEEEQEEKKAGKLLKFPKNPDDYREQKKVEELMKEAEKKGYVKKVTRGKINSIPGLEDW